MNVIVRAIYAPLQSALIDAKGYRLFVVRAAQSVEFNQDYAHVGRRAAYDMVNFGDMRGHFAQVLRAASVENTAKH